MDRKEYRLCQDTFLERAKATHGKRYDYSKSVYINKRTKVVITCPIHGDFEQLPMNHVRGQGCPICGKKYAAEWRKGKWENFINESIKRFGDIYEFPNIKEEYENSHSKITICCKKCGNVFIKIACDHLTSPHGGCMNCYANKSKGEEDIALYLASLLGEDDVKVHDRSILNHTEIDIYLKKEKIGIEYNGLYWHCEEQKDKNYHLNKTETAKAKGISLIHIFEDEFIYHKEIVLSKLRHIIGIDKDLNRIMGRKCSIHEISKKESDTFLEKNHIQGPTSASVYIGAYFNNLLIGVMTLKRELKNDTKWELTRFATDINYRCQGIGGKLFKYFVKNYNPSTVKSFADRRWTLNENNNMYTKIGFQFVGYTRPDYKYVLLNENIRCHKFGFRKQTLHKKYGLPLSMTETEMAKAIKAYKIWDCGLIKYVWTNKSF